jgi:hypothetical protein
VERLPLGAAEIQCACALKECSLALKVLPGGWSGGGGLVSGRSAQSGKGG